VTYELPPITGGARFWSVTRLIGYGVAHAAVVFLLALLVRHGLHTTPGTAPTWPPVLGILGLTGILFALRVLEVRDAEALGQDYVIRVGDASSNPRCDSPGAAPGHSGGESP